MAALPASQQQDWNNNIYVLAITRTLLVIGVAYLIKILYGLMPSMWRTRTASAAHVVADGLELANIVSDLPVMAPGAADISPDLEANLTLDVRRPQPTYYPPNYTEGSWASSPTQHRSAEVSGQSAVVQTITGQEVGPRNDDCRFEEDMDITVGYVRQETMAGSAVDEGIGEPAIPTPGDTIHPSTDA